MNDQGHPRPARRPMLVQNHLVNPVVRALLRARVHRLLSGAVALVTVTGRRNGRAYTTPVMYARDGDDLYTYVGSPERKTWWRNLREPQVVRVVVAGREFGDVAGVLDPAAQPDQVRAGLRAYARAFRRLRIDPEGALPPDLVMVCLTRPGPGS